MSCSAAERAEAGGSLIELLVCVALLVAGIVVALGGLPRLAHAAQSGLVRDGALEVARNAIERARAAAAYAPAASAIAATAAFPAVARIRPGLCGATAADVPLSVTTSFDAASSRFTVVVGYPRDPCVAGAPAAMVTLETTLPPAVPAPEAVVPVPIRDPARQ